MRAIALLSAVAITASLAVAIPGSVSEKAALASTPQTCESMHGTAEPALVDGSYFIDSVQKLVYLSVNQNTGSPAWRTRNFIQTAPIDLGGCSWTPIGAESAAFTGEYDGGGFPIHNLTIPSGTYSGLFGYTDQATITGVHLLDADLKEVERFSGTLVGQARRTTISDSSATGSISAIDADAVGGLVGSAVASTTISRSFSTVTVTRDEGSSFGDVYGGLVGALGGASGGSSIESSFATGAVSAGNKTGGLAGEVGGTSTISNSYARGAVTGGDGVGGLIGTLLNSANLKVTNSYATGKVSGDSDVGGLVGKKFSEASLTVTNSFWDKDTTERETTLDNKGSGKETTAMKSLSTFNDTTTVGLDAPWPIVERWQSFAPDAEPARIWGIRSDLNDGYPFLLWEYDTIPGGECAVVHGTEEPALLDGSIDTYVIDSAGKLVYLSVNQNTGSPAWRTRNFTQTATIDLQGCSWAPIGTTGLSDKPFTGEYDGGGFPIDNLTIPSGEASGLFGLTIGATITGVHLLDADLKAVGSFSGTLVGLARNTTISGSSATGSISASNANAVGGLVGSATVSTTISRSFSTVTVTRASGSGEAYGGLVGALGGAPGGSSIESSFATGAVSAGDRTGGLAGEVGGASTISNSYARGAVTGDVGVGGLIGTLLTPANLTVTNSYATGEVESATGGKVGGLIGDKATSSVAFTVTNSFWDKDTTEQNATLDNEGSGETTTAMKTLSTFEGASWSIASCRTTGEDTVWGIVAGGYPFLTWQDTPPLAACTTTAEPSSPSTRPRPTPEPISLEPVAPVVPQQFGGASATVGDNDGDPESTLDLPVTVDEATEPETEDAGGSPAVAGSDSDTDASGVGQASGNSTWLLVIGLSGLGAAALIAGGVAFARLRP